MKVHGHPCLLTEFEASLCYMRSCLKKIKIKVRGDGKSKGVHIDEVPISGEKHNSLNNVQYRKLLPKTERGRMGLS